MEDQELQETGQVTCTFRTSLPDKFKVPEEVEVQLATGSIN